MTDTRIADPKGFQEAVTAIGDHGSITFRKADGVVVERDFYSISDRPELHGYPFILRADPATLLYPDMDILHVGYWYQDNRGQLAYEPAIDMGENLAPPFDNTEPVIMKPFDLEKAKAGAPVVQRCGRPARIIDFALKNKDYPLAVVYTDADGDEHVTEFSVEGNYYDAQSEDHRDLLMATVKKEGWLNVYPSNMTSLVGVCIHIYPSQAAADEEAGKHRKACLHVKWEE